MTKKCNELWQSLNVPVLVTKGNWYWELWSVLWQEFYLAFSSARKSTPQSAAIMETIPGMFCRRKRKFNL